MSTTPHLLGPPEFRRTPPPPATIISDTQNLNIFEKADVTQDDVAGDDVSMGLTENRSPTFLTTGNPCLDFFFHVVPDTTPSDLIGRLKTAWEHDPLTTLKLICNLRGVRGTGKSDKESFYSATFWVHKNHPKTLAMNVSSFAHFGYFKDLLEILHRVVYGADVRKNEKLNLGKNENLDLGKNEKMNLGKVENRVLRKEREAFKARKALEMYNSDSDYRFLFDKVSDLFSELLKSDLSNLKSGNLGKIGLASKWCPTVDSSYDKSTMICESISRKLFPKTDPEYENLEEAHYVYRIRDRLRKEVLVPLHKALELPEVYMSTNRWDSLPYNRVASVAMKNYKKLFLKHDCERFKEYLENVKSGKAKIAAGALLPHEIIKSLNDGDGGEVAELQWKRMVDDLLKKGKLSNCIAICDVSGSMEGVPMEVSVALGVLVSEISEEPWKGKLITFSADPELHSVEGETLLEKTEFVRKMDWGMNTNFQKVFDQILEVAIEQKLGESEMVKRVFVFSDMEFDEASENSWETDYEAIRRKFRENGFGNSVPEIVFWNLRSSRSTSVVARQSGVALVSGFSKNLLSMFLEGGGIVNPLEVMELAISGEEYKQLVVYD